MSPDRSAPSAVAARRKARIAVLGQLPAAQRRDPGDGQLARHPRGGSAARRRAGSGARLGRPGVAAAVAVGVGRGAVRGLGRAGASWDAGRVPAVGDSVAAPGGRCGGCRAGVRHRVAFRARHRVAGRAVDAPTGAGDRTHTRPFWRTGAHPAVDVRSTGATISRERTRNVAGQSFPVTRNSVVARHRGDAVEHVRARPLRRVEQPGRVDDGRDPPGRRVDAHDLGRSARRSPTPAPSTHSSSLSSVDRRPVERHGDRARLGEGAGVVEAQAVGAVAEDQPVAVVAQAPALALDRDLAAQRQGRPVPLEHDAVAARSAARSGRRRR